MANGTITTTFTLKAVDALGQIYINESINKQIVLNAAAPNVSAYTLIIPTTAGGTALNLGSVAANGVAWFQNMDAANYVDIGIQQGGTFYPLIRLLAGESWPVRVTPGIAPYARANTASVVLKQPIMDA